MGAADLLTTDYETSHALSSRLDVEFDPRSANSLWLTMKRPPSGEAHYFSLPLLRELAELLSSVKQAGETWQWQGQQIPINYSILRSGDPDYFSLGGDLQQFRTCIAAGDREGLRQYAALCMEIMLGHVGSCNDNMTTIALVQGRALGGGFETALSADYLLAEEHSEFGFPEILFGLFPCTGAMSLLSRRIGPYAAERLMTNGRIYSAPELKVLGVVDEIYPRGQGVLGAEKFIQTHSRYMVARQMVQRERRRLTILDRDHLTQVVNDWVETAMNLSADELHVMDTLISMQRRQCKAA